MTRSQRRHSSQSAAVTTTASEQKSTKKPISNKNKSRILAAKQPRRSTRDAKQTTFYVPLIPQQRNAAATTLKYQVGNGTELGKLENFQSTFSKLRAEDAVVTNLHKLLYGRTGEKHSRKNSIFLWNGVPDSTMQKDVKLLSSKVAKLKQTEVREILQLFGLKKSLRSKAGEELVKFLTCPTASINQISDSNEKPQSARKQTTAQTTKTDRKNLPILPNAFYLYAGKCLTGEIVPKNSETASIKNIIAAWGDLSTETKAELDTTAELLSGSFKKKLAESNYGDDKQRYVADSRKKRRIAAKIIFHKGEGVVSTSESLHPIDEEKKADEETTNVSLDKENATSTNEFFNEMEKKTKESAEVTGAVETAISSDANTVTANNGSYDEAELLTNIKNVDNAVPANNSTNEKENEGDIESGFESQKIGQIDAVPSQIKVDGVADAEKSAAADFPEVTTNNQISDTSEISLPKYE